MPDDAAADAGTVLTLYPPQTDKDRDAFVQFVGEASFTYGVWNHFKQLYKQAQADPASDAALLGSLLARIDDAPLNLGNKDPRVEFDGIGGVTAVAVGKPFLYALGGRYYWNIKTLGVFAANPRDPMKPIKISELKMQGTGGNVSAILLLHSLLCFVVSRNNEATLHLVDVSDPKSPRLRGELNFNRLVFPAGRPQTFPYLYVTVAGSSGTRLPGLWSIDLSNPDAPQVRGGAEIIGLAAESGNLALDGTLAAVTTKPVGFTWRSLPKGGGLRLVDISDPARPRLTGSLTMETPLCVARRGPFAYVGIGSDSVPSNGLQIVDVSDSRHPRPLGFVPLAGFITGLTVSPDGRFVYARAQNGVIHTVDVGNASAPTRTHSTAPLYGVSDMLFAGELAYVSTTYQGTALFSVEKPQTPQRVGAPPSDDTIGYLKRRGRRFLRVLAKTDGSRYAEIATEMLLRLAGTATLDPTRHWAALDVVFGGGHRFRQTKHGRGRYTPTGQTMARLALRTREERAPGAWDNRPDLLARLLQKPSLPPSVQTFAARALRATYRPLPPLPDAVLEQWLASNDEPLLIALAVRQVTNRLGRGEVLPANIAADAFFKAGGAIRRRLIETQGGAWASRQRTWAEAFALRLGSRLQPAEGLLRLSRRQGDSAGLLARYFGWAITAKADVLLPLVAPFLASGRTDLSALIVEGAQKQTPEFLRRWLEQLGRVPEMAAREPVLSTLRSALSGVVLDRFVVRGLVFHAEEFVRAAGWRLIAASAADGELLKTLWTELLQSPQATPALTTAMGSADALGLLERAGIGAAELAAHAAARPFLVGLLSSTAFASVAETAPASVTLSLVAASSDEHYATLRPLWLRQLREGVGTTALWLAAEDALNRDGTGRLEARLLNDPEIAETFLSVEDERLLEIREPAFGPILGAWIRRSADRFVRNSPLLFDAATHPLPEVRTPSLVRVAQLGMDMPFALRLMESAVPPSVAVGKRFFDAEPLGGDRETDYALALCDSPFADVRLVGRDYVTARWETLPRERLLLSLFENPAPEMQAFVAAFLEASVRPEATPTFDAEVLRSTNRARKAKEQVKARQSAEATLDTAVLLTVARGRTPRDAEWAWGELARRAAQGEIIEGVTVEGVGGI